MTHRIHTIGPHITRSCLGLLVGSAVLVGSASAQPFDRDDRQAQEVAALRQQVAEQAEQLERLERALMRLRMQSPTDCLTLSEPEDLARGWRAEALWDCVAAGMSETTVIEILGRPTRVSPGAVHRTLHYEADVEGRGTIRGHVRIEKEEDRVVQIHRPTADNGR